MPLAGCLLPVTAVAFAFTEPEPEQKWPLIVAAEGSLIRVFCLKSRALLSTHGIFHNQTVHGLRCITNHQRNEDGALSLCNLNILTWGGRHITLVVLSIEYSEQGPKVFCHLNQPAQLLDDYILDACWSAGGRGVTEQSNIPSETYAVTVYNQLFVVNFTVEAIPEENLTVPRLISQGPLCALYSAHVEVLDSSSLLVAAGTVFGIVHVWRSSVFNISSTQPTQATPALVRSLHGHEGSVFGVRLFRSSYSSVLSHVVASCSDDRTIRVWSLPELEPILGSSTATSGTIEVNCEASTGFTNVATSQLRSDRPLAVIEEGHISRVWSVRFCEDLAGRPLLVSFGEDATARVWRLAHADSPLYEPEGLVGMQHGSTCNYHAGKNIWAGEISSDGRELIVTGGADGRLVFTEGQKSIGSTWTSERIDDSAISLSVQDSNLAARSESNLDQRSPSINQITYRDLDTESQVSPKTYCWLGEVSLLATTSDGRVCLGELRLEQAPNINKRNEDRGAGSLDVHWTCLAKIEELSSYALISSIPGKLALFSGRSGVVYMYSDERHSLQRLLKLPRKLGFLSAQSIPKDKLQHSIGTKFGAVAVCLGGKDAYLVPIDATSPSLDEVRTTLLRTIRLPTEFIVTSASFVSSSLLALGSRSGSLALYDVSNLRDEDENLPIAVETQVHGEDSITSILTLSASESTFVLTTGRDGHFAVHRINQDSTKLLTFETVHRVQLPMGPYIEGASLRTATQELILWGFQGRKFVVWNFTKQQSVMTVDCGGFHRSWSFVPYGSVLGAGNLVWTQASKCFIYHQVTSSHEILEAGLHGREIKAITIRPHPNEDGRHIVATGAEDTTLRISEYVEDAHVQPLRCLAVVYVHTAGIQKLLWSPDGKYLFSAAGREEFRVWRVQSVPCIETGIVEVASCDEVSEAGDLRIMDFDCILEPSTDPGSGSLLIIMGYSDSSIRLWRFSPAQSTNRMECLTSIVYSTVCITQCQFLSIDPALYILSCASNGYITLWRTSRVLESYNDGQINHQNFFATPGKPLRAHESWELFNVKSTRVHQSSIKSMTSKEITSTRTLIVTGGDDNAIGVSYVTVEARLSNHEPRATFVTLLIPKAHAAAINALGLIPTSQSDQANTGNSLRLVSASNDQHLKTWTVSLKAREESNESTDLISVRKVKSEESSVADVASLDLVRVSLGKLLIAGIGVEAWDISDSSESTRC